MSEQEYKFPPCPHWDEPPSGSAVELLDKLGHALSSITSSMSSKECGAVWDCFWRLDARLRIPIGQPDEDERVKEIQRFINSYRPFRCVPDNAELFERQSEKMAGYIRTLLSLLPVQPDPVNTYPTVVESVRLLEAAGFGAVGKPNTLLAMVKEAIAAARPAQLHNKASAICDDKDCPLHGDYPDTNVASPVCSKRTQINPAQGS